MPVRRKSLLPLLLIPAFHSPLEAQEQPATLAETFVAADIRVEGLQRIAMGTVLTYLPIERGDLVTSSGLAESLRSLYKTGFFEDVRLDRQGDILVVTVTERPAVNKLTLDGNKDIKTEDLLIGLKDIGLSEGDTFNRLSLDRVTQELVRQYNNRGKYTVEITPTVSALDRNRVDVTITVKEGKAAKIRHVNVVGAEKFETEDLLENWESKETSWLSWYRRDDQYSKEKLSGDMERLNSWYLDRGYVDFNIDSTQVSISPDKRDMFITAGITEGEQYKISDVKVTGDTVLPKEEIEKLVIVKPEQTFSRILLEMTSDSITATLGNIGHAFAQVNPIPTIDRENRTVAINLQVVPGPRVNVRRIVFKGNTRTSDEVMRREMRQFEGSWFSQVAVDRSRVRLRRLGFFETVDAETSPVPGTDDQVDVVFTVKETTSGSFMFGLGYSQTDGLTTSFELSQNNFTGSGNRIAVSAKRNSYQNAYSFSYTNPYFTDEGLALGYQATWSEIDYSDYNAAQYNTTNTAFQSVFGLPISENDSVSMSLGIDSKQVTVYESYTPQAIIDYIDAVGQRTFHAWRSELGWARDTRNDYFMPTSGMYQRVSADIALPGSTVEYFKINYDLSKYWPLAPWLVMLTRAELGYGDSYGADIKRYICRANGSDPQVSGQTASDGSSGPGGVCGADATLERTLVASGLPFFENFYAGGTRSIRGFEDNSLGPRSEASSSYPDGQPLGGSFKTIGSVELLFPKLFDSNAARVSAFLDIGNVFDGYESFDSKELRASTGIALLWRAPVGPISISYSFPVRKEEGDKLERLQFSFGGGF